MKPNLTDACPFVTGADKGVGTQVEHEHVDDGPDGAEEQACHPADPPPDRTEITPEDGKEH